ncbi:MAG TPA: YicC/YloC family endoribonuclease [Candidatus Competibacteraceae bacterium]|nr:YicC/YloC family endoribonuclease [Candidatus Competibacteraceae bacterium]
MIRSMTAFARREHGTDWGAITWELRSVNHRYLEVALRLPDTLRALEPAVRERIAAVLSRGKVEAQLKLTAASGALAELSFNRELAGKLLAVAAELEHMMGPGTGLRPIDVLRWPGVVSEPEPDQEAIHQAVLACLDAALKDMVATRSREGERIREMLESRCTAMAEQVKIVRARRPQVLARLREKLLARLAELPVEPDSSRLEQELVLAAQRLDVDEELDRLDAHLAEIRDVLARPEPVGRRLDFLMQELNREANTLSSKAGDGETTRAAVELKVLIEQMREQVQNVE